MRKCLAAVFFILLSSAVIAQNTTARIYGKITGENKKPLPGVSIGIAGTALGVIDRKSVV